MEDHTFDDADTDSDILVEEREAVMYGGNPTLRKAHFLKPIFSEHHAHLPPPLSSSKPKFDQVKKYELKLYKGNPSEKWKDWVHILKPKYQKVWKQAGIYEAILASTYTIPKEKNFILGLAERWCADTNTFVFPWGEVTITLEDVMFLGGFSVLGAFYLTPLADECADIYESLRTAYKEVRISCGNASASKWMEYFMFSGKQFEHEAFLAMWLSRFVLVRSKSNIATPDFHVAIHLSRGHRIALAPVVLASIYTDMRLLHNSMVKSMKLVSKDRLQFNLCHADLVHMWVWERFPQLRPTPSVTKRTDPRAALWNGVTIIGGENVRAALDSTKESFVWRPYVITSSNCMLSKLYGDNEKWAVVKSDDTESLARCLRASELIGLGDIEQYLPHRVAMQFGLDQDVPCPVIRSNQSPKTAWRSYNRSIRGMKLYIPPRLVESDVSSRYVIWWKGLLPVNEQAVTSVKSSVNLKEDAVFSNSNHALVDPSKVIIKLAKGEVVSKGETCDNAVTDTYTLVEERLVSMYSPCGRNPTLRNAHFLKPIYSEHNNHVPSQPTSLFSLKPNSETLKYYSLESFKQSPSEKWKTWVHSLKPKFQETWKQAGIYEAILASTYKIPKDKELIIGLAQRWCAETNTFIFPWGEVTITLEDVMFLGGFSVLGALFSNPRADEFVGICDCLKKAHKELRMVPGSGGDVTAVMWMEFFMCSGKKCEHEAFLTMWLSRFVLVRCNGKIVMKDFHAAVHLSRGNRIALAPAVLASIYTNMRLLRNSIVKSIKLDSKVCSRLYLFHADIVHMWVWERFPKLRPTPCVMEGAESRSARWNGVNILKDSDVNATLDSGKESFIWRPYVTTSSNCILSKLYRDNEQWVVVKSEDTESFARCLRVSELVGLDNIEQYLPHRVAMQFGLDQDIPALVIRSNESSKTAWSSYDRSFRGMKLYIPPRFYESDVSSRYVVWWRGLVPVNEEGATTCIRNEKYLSLISWGHKRRRSRKTLSRKSKIFEERNDLDDMLVLKTHAGTETPAKRFCITKPMISSVWSKSSSDKSKGPKFSAERSVNLKEDAAVDTTNHAEANNVNIKFVEDEVVSNINCPENKIVNIKEETCDNSTSELPHLGLITRILRLEIIVDAIKAAKLDASSSGY